MNNVKLNGIIVDDSTIELAEFIKDASDFGINLHLCKDVEEFFNQLSYLSEIDLLVVDSVLSNAGIYTNSDTDYGRYTGLMVIKDIRNDRRKLKINNKIPIVILTNLRNDSIVNEFCKKYMPCIYVQKPVEAREFAKKLKAFNKECRN